jgi:NAD(P)-dependent dehydrogenase (short-subunit alcohol dehydrogenase family)
LAEHADLRGVVAHVGRSEEIERLVQAAEDQFGTVNILVNNAGTSPFFGPILQSDLQAWDKTMEVNVRGPYLLSKACAARMIASGGGAIINVASVAGLRSFPMQGIYSVSKAALIMLTKVMAKELGGQGVRVNCICPGLIKTRLSEAIWSDPHQQRAATAMKALGRIGEPEELVGAAIYLASDASSFTTGAVLQVDGGMLI